MSRGVSVTASPAATRARMREHVARDERDVGLEAGGDARVAHDAALGGRDPRVVRELGQADGAPAREAVLGADGDHERLVEELVAAQAGCSRRGVGRVLEEHGDMQAAVGHARSELLDGALDRLHALGHHARDRRRHQRGQRAGEAADAQRAPVVAELGELGVGQRQALGQRLARARARPSRRRSASSPPAPRCSSRAPSSRSSAATCWETAGWVSDELARGGRERAGVRDGAEGEQPARIQH